MRGINGVFFQKLVLKRDYLETLVIEKCFDVKGSFKSFRSLYNFFGYIEKYI